MARPNPMYWPAALWYEPQGIKLDRNYMRHNPLYVRHDAHVTAYKRNVLPMRRYHSNTDHDSHVKLFKRLIKQAVMRVHAWEQREGVEGKCLLFTGLMGSKRPVPRAYIGRGTGFTAAVVYQEQVLGKGQPGRGLYWITTCGDIRCIEHRVLGTGSQKSKQHQPTPELRKRAAAVGARKNSPHGREKVLKCIELRRQGLMYREIAALTGVPRGSVTNYVSGRHWSDLHEDKHNGMSFIAKQLGA